MIGVKIGMMAGIRVGCRNMLVAAAGLFAFLSGACEAAEAVVIPDISGQVMTVRGPVDPSTLGLTLTHEHIFMDYTLPLDQPEKWASIGVHYPSTAEELEFWHRPLAIDMLSQLQIAWPANHDALVFDDAALAIEELQRFSAAGGSTVVDMSTSRIGRNPEGLRLVAEQTGLNIVMGAGWYRDEWMDDSLVQTSIEDMTAAIVRDIVLGVGDTGIRSGIIGEVGVESHEPADPLTDRELKSLVAAGRAAMLTGAALSLHTLLVPPQKLEVLDRLAAEKVDPGRVVVGHLSAVVARDFEYLLAIARRGVYLQFDLFGFRESTVVEEFIDDRTVVKAIAMLVEQGYGDRILVSQDTAIKLQLTRYGGYGYAFVPKYLIPHMLANGFSVNQVEQITRQNPARILAFVAPRGLSAN